METKLCVSLCALLLLGLGSADHGSDQSVSSPSTTAPEARTKKTDTPVPHEDTQNVTQKSTTATPAAATPPDGAMSHRILMTNQTGDANRNQNTTLEPPLVTTAISSNESHSSNSTSRPLKVNHTSSSLVSVVTSDPLKETHTSTTVPPAKSTTASDSSPISTKVISSSHPTTNVLQHSESTTQVHIKASTKLANITTTKTEIHTDTSSKLNIKGDTKKDSKSPPLDPLLAGLVSAFIITAVIITLLLFLKLRRRDTRPEFRRLQELPMDDMEDTPLSMYSY
ncbi:uncharacterized protein LOC128766689 isoform X2 [Synchiropus splendidus]|uniref:uncharacterized protein LOC128766689 isoform X2 n=1 Tax=Synchiropus splendidus TaxID=270530 RepID=UPI00237D8EDD|nr:uncharacterized protein LOC128766689 isoform X2 [Synchiropus splendidus]